MINTQSVLKHIAKSIKRKIDDAGYTSVDQFCKKHNIIKTTVYRAIHNERSPRLLTLIQIANALEITLQELMDLGPVKEKKAKVRVKKK